MKVLGIEPRSLNRAVSAPALTLVSHIRVAGFRTGTCLYKLGKTENTCQSAWYARLISFPHFTFKIAVSL